MFDAKKLLDQFLGSEVPGAGGTVKDRAGQLGQLAKDNPLATGAIAAVLLGTGTGRQLTGSALKLGGLAAIAGLGYTAWKNWKARQEPGAAPADAAQPASEPVLLPPPDDSSFSTESDHNSGDFALVLVQAMIAAARADGHVDDAEKEAILGKVKLAGLDADAEAFLERQLNEPIDLDRIVAAATSETQKVELYTAVRIAIDPDTRAERGFLDLLAGRLGLDDALLNHIDATVSSAKMA